jgi:hypothetical protein
LAVLPSQAQTPYAFGNPTAEEQLYIEYMNRARANPTAEGIRLAAATDKNITDAYFSRSVVLSVMQAEFAAIPVRPPLAPNAKLMSEARSHALWMLVNGKQSHYEGAGNALGPGPRFTAEGYSWGACGENVFAYSQSPWHAHAGLNVDWGSDSGGTTSGMQSARAHRKTLHNADPATAIKDVYREIGIGTQNAWNTTVTPAVGRHVISQDFGTQLNSDTFFSTGVAYYDLNDNDFYDIGEGIPGLNVAVTGSSEYCVTAAGGGWVVPVPNAATSRNVTFTGSNLSEKGTLVHAASSNAKYDLKLDYTGPTITSATTAYNNSPYMVTFLPVPGASTYKWRRWTSAAAPTEACDSTAGVTTAINSGIAVQSTTVKAASSTGSFRLAITSGTKGDQTLQLNRLFRGSASASMSFQNCLRLGTAYEQYKVQVKEEGSALWRDVDSQSGSTGTSGASFSARPVSLASMVNKNFRIRFIAVNQEASSYPAPFTDIYGWFIDTIQFTNVQQLTEVSSTDLSAANGAFTPSSQATYLQGVSPVISGTEFPASVQTLTVGPAATSLTFAIWSLTKEILGLVPLGILQNNPLGDYDNDGRPNLLEYAFGTSPTSANDNPALLPAATVVGGNLQIEYKVDTSLAGLTTLPQAGSDAAGWFTPGQQGAPTGFVDQLISTTGSIQSRRAVLPITAGSKGFLRIKVTTPP